MFLKPIRNPITTRLHKKTITWSLALLLMASAGQAKDFPVAGFGATGDEKTDDGAAIQRAVDAALAAGASSRVIFEPKTYRLDWRKDVTYQISLAGAKDASIEGNGAMLIAHPRNNLISLTNCMGVSVKGFTVDFDQLPYTQGMITEVNAKDGWINVRIHNGYRQSRR
jgi:polygalacturonase